MTPPRICRVSRIDRDAARSNYARFLRMRCSGPIQLSGASSSQATNLSPDALKRMKMIAETPGSVGSPKQSGLPFSRHRRVFNRIRDAPCKEARIARAMACRPVRFRMPVHFGFSRLKSKSESFVKLTGPGPQCHQQGALVIRVILWLLEGQGYCGSRRQAMLNTVSN